MGSQTANSSELSGGESNVATRCSPNGFAIIGDALSAALPFLDSADARRLSRASPTTKALLQPATRRAERASRLARKLHGLPFNYGFALQGLGPQPLTDALAVLRILQPLRRRDRVGEDGGWVPTEEDPWWFQSQAELGTIASAGRLALQGIGVSGTDVEDTLVLGATLRAHAPEGGAALAGTLWTEPMGVEWANGPAADPLQLGLKLGLGPGENAFVDLELTSGGWSPWAETWALRDGTLAGRVSVAAVFRDGGEVRITKGLSRWSGNPGSTARTADLDPGGGDADGSDDVEGYACQASSEGACQLREALLNAQDAGVRVVICIRALQWRKCPPVWCPPEVCRVAIAGPLLESTT